jgi:serine protease Do
VLRELDGQKIVNGSALQVAVSQMQPGNTIRLGILRDGKPETLTVKVGEFHSGAQVAENGGADSSHRGRLGLTVAELTPQMRNQINVPDRIHGAVIESVRPGSPADDAGLAPGDVVMEVNRHKVEGADAFVSQVSSAPAGKDILLLVWSKGGASYRVVHPVQESDGGM